jgi:hypothetical protein
MQKNKIALGVIVAGIVTSLTLLAAQNLAYAAKPQDGIPVTSTADASVTRFAVAAAGNDITVQFNYDLENGARSAVIDAVLNQQQSMGQLTIYEPGTYIATERNLPDGNYAVYLFISGNPDYLTGDPGPSNQPYIVTLPAGSKKFGMGDRMMRDFRQYFHAQQKLF